MRSRPYSACVGLVIVVLSCADTETLAHENEEIEEIVVRGRWDRLTSQVVSASQGFVSQAEIDLRPRLRPGDILEIVPGLVVTQHSGAGKSNQMFLRGFNLDHGTDFATWIDGMPINIPTHGHGQGYTDLNFIIPELVDSLEFRKGPYYADVQDFSSAGAAFFSTPSKLDSRIVKAGVGKDLFTQFLYADSFSTVRGDIMFGVQTNRYDGPWVGVSEDLAKYNGIFRYTDSTDDLQEWGVTVMAYEAVWDAADQIPSRAVATGAVSRLGTIDDTVGGNTSRYSISGRWHRDLVGHQLTGRAYAIDYELDLFSNFSYFLDDPVNGDQIEQVDQRQIYGGDVTWKHPIGDSAIHRSGLVFRFDDIGKVGLYKSALRTRLNTVREDVVNQLSVGFYYDFDYSWNRHWRSTVGARADYYHFNVDRSLLPENTGTNTDWILSPKFNLIRTMSDNMEAYFSVGRGFHSNDARGTVIQTNPVNGDSIKAVDPLVQSTGAEIGFRLFSEDKLNLSAAIWTLELDSELLFVGDAGNTEPTNASRRYGLEVPAYFRLGDQWLFDFELSLSKSRFTEAGDEGDEIPGSLDRVLAAGVAGNFANGMYGTMRVRHFGERPLVEDGSIESGRSTVWNLGFGYKKDKFDIRLEVLNIFDSASDDIAYYYTSRLPGEPLAGIDDTHFHPIEPRTYRAYVTWYGGPR